MLEKLVAAYDARERADGVAEEASSWYARDIDYKAALYSARAYLASPPTVDPAVRRWQEVDADSRYGVAWELRKMTRDTGNPRWHLAASALEALAASGGEP